MVQSFVAQSKDYTFLPQLNNMTSARCNGVEEARFMASDLEYACDRLEKVLAMRNGSYKNISGADYLRLPYNRKEMYKLKQEFRLILSDQDVNTKFKEYREFKALADNLEQENKKRKEEAKKERKAKRAEEKQTQF